MCSDEGRGQSDLDRPLAARVAPAIGSATSGVRSRLAASYHRPGAHAHRSVAGTFPSPLQAPRPQVRGAFWFSDPMPVSGPSRWPGPYRAPRPSGERPRPGRTRRRRWPAPGPGWRAGSRPRRPPSAKCLEVGPPRDRSGRPHEHAAVGMQRWSSGRDEVDLRSAGALQWSRRREQKVSCVDASSSGDSKRTTSVSKPMSSSSSKRSAPKSL